MRRYDFVSWLLNTLNKVMRKRKVKNAPKTSIILETFQGELQITSRTLPPTEAQLKDGVLYDADDKKLVSSLS